jgi:hypothetical protein
LSDHDVVVGDGETALGDDEARAATRSLVAAVGGVHERAVGLDLDDGGLHVIEADAERSGAVVVSGLRTAAEACGEREHGAERRGGCCGSASARSRGEHGCLIPVGVDGCRDAPSVRC